MAKTFLTLVLPGLASIVQQKINDTILPPSFKKIMSKSQFEADDSNLTRLLFNAFSETVIVSSDLPYAQLLAPQTTTICATPCYLHADRDRLLLFANEHRLSEQECADLIDELQPLFIEFDAKLIRHQSGELLLQLNTLPNVSFSALADVKGKAVTDYLPKGEDRINWIRLWNEIQMKLYDSNFNQQRQQAEKMPINSLWFWGRGKLQVKRDYWHSVQGEYPILKQLTQASSARFNDGTSNSVESLDAGRHLWVLDELNLENNWQQQLDQWQQDLLKPIWEQCRQAKINQLNLVIPEYGSYQLTSLASWKFW